MTANIADLVPTSAIAREATELIRDATTELIYHHCRRVFLFGTLRGRDTGVDADPELLYVGAMFHDLGLVDPYRSDRRFELDGADEARRFLLRHGIDDAAAERVWTAIALHTTPEIPRHMAPEIALVTRGVELDVMGVEYDALDPAERDAVVAEHPRPGFKEGVIAAFCAGIRDRPDTTFGNVKADVLAHCVPGFERGDFVEAIRSAPWPE